MIQGGMKPEDLMKCPGVTAEEVRRAVQAAGEQAVG